MANQEQLEILKQGVDVWNQWRIEHSSEEIDLKVADLSKLDLRGANLSNSDLRKANLRNTKLVNSSLESSNLEEADLFIADLWNANLQSANLQSATLESATLENAYLKRANLQDSNLQSINLRYASLQYVNLQNANLAKANLFGADLHEADLHGADLHETNLRGVNLLLANLRDAKLHGAIIGSIDLQEIGMKNTNLQGADLQGANIRGADLRSVCLKEANLENVDLQGADLRLADLWGANLKGADLQGADMQGTNMQRANLRGANVSMADVRFAQLKEAKLTGIRLFASAKEHWQIDDVCCDYVFWDRDGKERTPPDRNFRLGEFEELYKLLPTFEYVFEHGLTAVDMVVMARVVETINRQNPDFKLDLVNFDKRGEPHATFTVQHRKDVEAARQQVKEEYEMRFAQMEGDISRMQRMLDQLADRPHYIINQLQGAIDMGDTYINQGQVGAMGKDAQAQNNIFQQIATDLSHLHEYMDANATTPEQQASAADVAAAAQAAKAQDKPKMQQYLKNAGKWALNCAKEIGTDVAAEYLKKVTLGL